MLIKIALMLAYIAAAIVIAWFGQNRKWGFWGYLWASILMTPLVGFLLILASDAREQPEPEET